MKKPPKIRSKQYTNEQLTEWVKQAHHAQINARPLMEEMLKSLDINPQDVMVQKFCVDCRHHASERGFNPQQCRYGRYAPDLVNGKVDKWGPPCHQERAPGRDCGPEAKRYERKWWKLWRPE